MGLGGATSTKQEECLLPAKGGWDSGGAWLAFSPRLYLGHQHLGQEKGVRSTPAKL